MDIDRSNGMRQGSHVDPLDIAAQCLRADRAELAPPERIKSGLTNESWLVRGGPTAVVVRLSNREAAALQIDRQSEASILSIVADAGIGAPVVFCSPEQHVLVTQFIAGRVWTARDARAPENIERIAALLRRLHALPIPAEARYVDLWKIVHGYWNTLLARGLSTRAGSPTVRERARQYIGELASDAHLCLCHNDPHHLNVIDNNRLWLIDWEYAGLSDPYFDLAGICCYHALSDAARRALLRAYFGYEERTALERLQRMCWVFNYIRDLWFAVREME